MTGSSV